MKRRSGIGFFVTLILLGLAVYWLGTGIGSLFVGRLTYSEVVELFEAEKVRAFQTYDGELTLELREPMEGKKKYRAQVSEEVLRQDLGELFLQQQEKGVLEKYDFLPYRQPTVFGKAFPYLIAGGILLVIWVLLTHKVNSSNPMAGFTKAKTKLGSDEAVTFRDVAGAEEEKQELQELVEFLQDPQKFHDMGAKIPKGVLLVGPPGTGKTLLARAVAGESKAAFLSISASDFMEMYVGVGAGRVRDLFEQAKKVAPAIIFIDEIDAVGRRRGSGMGGGHDEREQTLNQLLVEMDGFQKNENIVVLAATNRADILDPALLRPGRFDRQIYVGRPDAIGREEILKIHCRNKRLDGQVDLKRVALGTAGFTGADLENLMNEAAIQAVRAGRPVITGDDIQEAMMKILAGPEKRNRVQLQKDLRITAIHEAGHAVAMYHLKTAEPVHQISIIPRGKTLGVTVSLPTEESTHLTRNQMYEEIVGLLGGRVAEQLFCDDISTGAAHDIGRATKIARDMVALYGMSEKVGTLAYDDGEEIFIGRSYEKTRSYSEQTAGSLDVETKHLVDKAFDHCVKLLKENEDKLMAVTDFLLEKETMSGAQFRACMEGRPIDPEDKTDLFAPVEDR